MYRKEIHDVRQAVNALETDITAAITELPDNITDDLQAAKAKIKVLREALLGAENTSYYYECHKKACKKPCKLELCGKLDDLTFCMDTLQSGDGEFVLVNTVSDVGA